MLDEQQFLSPDLVQADRRKLGGYAASGALVATVPMILLFLVAQRHFVRGAVTQRVEE